MYLAGDSTANLTMNRQYLGGFRTHDFRLSTRSQVSTSFYRHTEAFSDIKPVVRPVSYRGRRPKGESKEPRTCHERTDHEICFEGPWDPT